MRILVSACLLGFKCRYDGKSCGKENVIKLMEKHELIPFCPEIYGGLATPRDPAEIIEGKVITNKSADVTSQYIKGAEEALRMARLYGCGTALLKEKSPSCGSGKIYDGSFSGTLTDGWGIAAKLLSENGIRVLGESDTDKLE